MWPHGDRKRSATLKAGKMEDTCASQPKIDLAISSLQALGNFAEIHKTVNQSMELKNSNQLVLKKLLNFS